MAKSRTQGATGKGCGSYSVSHPDITHTGSKTKEQRLPLASTMGPMSEGNSYSGPGMAEKLPKGKGK
jgi:hypothetical protein